MSSLLYRAQSSKSSRSIPRRDLWNISFVTYDLGFIHSPFVDSHEFGDECFEMKDHL